MRLPRIVTLIAFLFGAGAFLAALSGGSPGAPRIVEPLSLDAKLARVLHHASFTGRVESTLEKRLGRPIDPDLADLGRLLFFDKDPGPARRQRLRGLPLAVQRLRRHAIDRHRRPEQRARRPAPRRPAQPAPHADGPQHRVLPEAHVERPLPQRLGRSVRQLAGLHCSRARRGRRSSPRRTPTFRICSWRRRTFRRRSRSRSPGSPGTGRAPFDDGLGASRAAPGRERLPQRADPPGGPRAAERVLRPTARFRRALPGGRAGRPDRLLDVRPGDRGVRVHADFRRRADRPVRARGRARR